MSRTAKLILSIPGQANQEFVLATAAVTLGRATTNDLVVADPRASRTHARLEWRPEGWTLVDLGAANKTYLNDLPIAQALLQPGDQIRIGEATLHFVAGDEALLEQTLINSMADLEATLAQATLPVTLSDVHGPRLAVYTPTRTWEIPLLQESITIGRQATCDVVLDRANVSRQHARIERQGDDFLIRDLNSTNGTRLGAQPVTAQRLVNGDTVRIGDAQLIFKSGFEPEELTLMEGVRTTQLPVRRPVVIVPGMMGSNLWLGSQQVWPNVRYLFTNPELFRLPDETPLLPRGIVNDVVVVPNLVRQEQYGRLSAFLQEALGYRVDVDLLEFAYDWRQDVRGSARRLAETIDGWNVQPPITIIAHSLGCLVSRYYVERLGGKEKVGRLLLMGGPHQGVPQSIPTLLSGPGLLPFGLFGERMREVLTTFPSAYQILPIYDCVFDQTGRAIDVLADDRWLPPIRRIHLRTAREFRQELGNHSSVPAVSIFGYDRPTTVRVDVQQGEDGSWRSSRLETKSSGDDSVPEFSTVLDRSDVHPVQQGHGSLYVDQDVKMRLKLELTRP